MLQVAFYSMLDDLGVTLPYNAKPVPDAEMLPEDDWQDNWQPDDLPGYVHGTDELVAPHDEEEGSYFTRTYLFLSG
jgi:hypothetical protein